MDLVQTEKIKELKDKREKKDKTKKIREPKEKTREPKKSPIKITDETIELKSSKKERLNEKLIDLLERLSNLMSKKGEHFKSRAYKTAQETVMSFTTDITDINELKGKPGIGETIMTKFKEYMETGTLELLEREKENPENILSDIYGVGPKKAKELVDMGIDSIAALREKQDEVLNDKQKIGLRYYEDILERIPRSEIDEYKEIFQDCFDKVREPESKYEIVGSYRRGAKSSGDIDVIITSLSDKVFKEFIDLLVEQKIIIEVLSRGSHKCLVIGKLANRKHARRIDFLYATPEEYPFSVLYFTGSKAFNTVMRGHALKMGYSLNEHEFSIMTDKKKGGKVSDVFKSEKDIFDFLKLKYKEPVERIDGRAVETKDGSPIIIELNKMIDEKIEKHEEKNDSRIYMDLVEKKEKTKKIREPKEKKVKTEKIREPKEKKLTKDEEIIVLKKRAMDCENKLLNAAVVSPKGSSDISPDNLPVVVSSENPILPPAYTNEPSQLNIVPINEIKKELKSKKVREPKDKSAKTMKKREKVSTNTVSTPPKSKEELVAIVNEFKTKGISVIENLSEKDLTDICELCTHYYHNMHPLITDNEYDVIRDFLDNKYPNHRLMTEIGAPIEKNKVRLPYQMASMDKIKPDSNILSKWVEKYPGPYVLSCKLDGVSGMYSTEGDDAKLYTRGDGNVGQDISHLISTLKLPKHKGYVVRGEFIIPKKVFETKYKEKFANPRNLVSGIINSKSVDEKAKDLHFVTYEVIKPSLKPSEQMNLLAELNHEVVMNKSVSELSNELLSEILVDWRTSYTYEIDGVIVNEDKIHPRKAGNPEHAFAFKMVLSDQMAEAKVTDVVWSASKDGYLKPRVRIEPVRLGGVTIEYATGFNGKFIEDNKIGVGAVIQLIRSGDVIPYIKSVTTPAVNAKMPDVPYKWTSTHVDIMLENVEDDITVREKNITAFFTELEVDGLSGGNVKRIMAAGYDTIPKILKMDKADFNKVEGFKDKMIEKISSGIRDKVAGASLLEIMVASNLLGRGMGSRKIKPILDKYPNILTSGESNPEKIQMLRGVDGIGPENSKSFVENIPLFLAFLKECNLESKLSGDATKVIPKSKEPEVKDTSNPLYGKKIVMTKVRDKEIIEYMKTVGATLEDGIKKDTFILIVKSHDDVSNKTKDAESKGIPILTPEEFKQKYM
jgi:NAD-dependent DNA ligase/DNA polymerase/3'-5' exonuclease PolX